MKEFQEILGQEAGKRAIEIALAGKHDLFLIGIPNIGKTMLIKTAKSLGIPNMPKLTESETCTCGYYGDTHTECTCSLAKIKRFRKKASWKNALMTICMSRVYYDKMRVGFEGEPSIIIKDRILETRKFQQSRIADKLNCDYDNVDIKEHCQICDSSQALYRRAIDVLSMTTAQYQNSLKVARTIADLDNSKDIGVCHVAESIQYHYINRSYNY